MLCGNFGKFLIILKKNQLNIIPQSFEGSN